MPDIFSVEHAPRLPRPFTPFDKLCARLLSAFSLGGLGYLSAGSAGGLAGVAVTAGLGLAGYLAGASATRDRRTPLPRLEGGAPPSGTVLPSSCTACEGTQFVIIDDVKAPCVDEEGALRGLHVCAPGGCVQVGRLEAFACGRCGAVEFFVHQLERLPELDATVTLRQGDAPCRACRCTARWDLPFGNDDPRSEEMRVSVCRDCGLAHFRVAGGDEDGDDDPAGPSGSPSCSCCPGPATTPGYPWQLALASDPAWPGLASLGALERRTCPACGRCTFCLRDPAELPALLEKLGGRCARSDAGPVEQGPYRTSAGALEL